MRKNIMISVFAAIFLLVGCSNSDVYEQKYVDTDNSAGTDYRAELPTINQVSSQIGMMRRQAVSNEGLYIIDGSHVFYYDFNANQYMNWCNQPNCSHNNIDCCGFVPSDMFYQGYIFYQDHKVYLISKDDSGAYLEQYHEDGSGRVRLGKLWSVNSIINNDKTQNTADVIKLDHGKIYYGINDNYKKIIICSMDLKKGSSPNIIIEHIAQGEKINLSSILINNESVYYTLYEKKGDKSQYDTCI